MHRPRKMFPRIPYSRQRARTAPPRPAAGSVPFTKSEMATAQRTLRASGPRAVCPRCKQPFGSVRRGTVGSSGHEVWMAHCAACRRSLSVPVQAEPLPAPGFATLVHSRPANRSVTSAARRAGFAVALHVVLIYGAVVATGAERDAVEVAAQDTMMVVLVRSDDGSDEPPPVPAVPVVARPPAMAGFQTLAPPADIPVDLPPVDVSERWDPRDYSGEGVEGGVFGGMVVEANAGRRADEPFALAGLDEPPVLLGCGTPRYPSIMRAAGIEGSVVANFVIDTAGRAEPASIAVVRSTDGAFEAPAIEQIGGCEYRPGRVGGYAVRVYVTLTVDFTLAPRRGAS